MYMNNEFIKLTGVGARENFTNNGPIALILTENENDKYLFFDYLLSYDTRYQQTSYMCIQTFETSQILSTKPLKFKTIGIYNGEKIDEYTKSFNGLIFLVKNDKINKKYIEKFLYLQKLNKNIPKLLAIEFKNSSEKPNEYLVQNITSLTSLETSVSFVNFDKNISLHSIYKNFSNKLKSSKFQGPVIEFKDIKTSKTLTDLEILTQFKTKQLAMKNWDHYGRLRVVYLCLKKFGYVNTISQDEWLCTHWKAYKKEIGHLNLWNYTLTRFWIEIIYTLIKKHPNKTFDEIYNQHYQIQNGKLHEIFYTNEILFGKNSIAKNVWVKPNKQVS